jgi:hypothetical protein
MCNVFGCVMLQCVLSGRLYFIFNTGDKYHDVLY